MQQIKAIFQNPRIPILGLVLAIFAGACSPKEAPLYDVVIYGATPAGIISAVTASDHGANVLLVEPMGVIGGMYTSGLNTAESEHMIDDVITGRARDFFIQLGKENYDPAYFQTFGNGRGLRFKEGDPAFFFESKHALALFEKMIREAGVEVWYNTRIVGVEKKGAKIIAAHFNNDERVPAQQFIDCSYEGDLMAQAGVAYNYGRESIDKYDESLAGIRLIDDTLSARTVDESGKLLPYFTRYADLQPGAGDKRVMNYNFRPIMTKVESNKLPLYPPEGYDPADFDFVADFLQDNPVKWVGNLIGTYKRGSGKYEFNNQQKSLVSLGMFGANLDYTEGSPMVRQKIYDEHKRWTLGLLYFLANDPRVPENLRQDAQAFGFAKDEFLDNNHFPNYLYVREGRRMIGELVQTQHDVFRDRTKPESVMLGSHWIDSHHVQRIALSDSTFVNEGRIWEIVSKPFEISYRTLTPQKQHATNLLVPVCASFTHVAFCAYRLESTWMQAGHVAGIAATMAIESQKPVQDIDVEALQKTLQEEGMIIRESEVRDYEDYADYPERYGDVFERVYRQYGLVE